jgi:TRAP-type C4-dicarboxylate transport system permease small subunit
MRRELTLRKIARKIIDFLEFHIATIILGCLFISVVMQVILRYVFQSPSPELFEIAGYAFIWVIFLGASVAQRYRSHMRFDMLYKTFSRKTQLIIDIVFDTLFSIALVCMFIPVVRQIIFLGFIKSDVLRISWTYLLLCFPLFIVLTLIHNINLIYKNVSEFLTGRTTVEEVPPWQ